MLLGIGLGSLYLTRDRTIPVEWVDRAGEAFQGSEPIDPSSTDDIIANSATLLGISAGAILLLDWGEFDPEGTWGQRLGRYVVGLVGLVLLFFGLRMVLPTEPMILGKVLRFVRYTLVGLWVAYLAPRLFVRLRLA
jgi:hypothetical protein